MLNITSCTSDPHTALEVWHSSLPHHHLPYNTLPRRDSPVESHAACPAQRSKPRTPLAGMTSFANMSHVSGVYQEQENYYTDGRDIMRRTLAAQFEHAHHTRPCSVSRQSSPAHSQHSYASSVSHTRQASQASSIAPSLQIPRTINNSQGSLSELAAQITCLFWFESATVLDYAENHSSSPLMNQAVNPDTIPTTGFRKWVTTILSTTQVAQNVVLLALLFIYRLKKQNPSVKGKLGSEYRLLTVALMLGNKFLDDNTYTNKTWAEVSGISVMEVHIMEVEFLSNMKYNLATSAEQWAHWQIQLGRFARFLDRPTFSPTQHLPAIISCQTGLSPTSLPSPPTSFQASPPRAITPFAHMQYCSTPLPDGSLPVTAQAHVLGQLPTPVVNARKRSLEADDSAPAKRVMYQSSQQHTRPVHTSAATPQETPSRFSQAQLPPLGFTGTHQSAHEDFHRVNQLPPIDPYKQSVAPSPAPGWQNTPASVAIVPSVLAHAQRSAQGSRMHSPYIPSANVSPTNGNQRIQSRMAQSPSTFPPQRTSPYKPVRGVNTLLVPPPARIMHQPERVSNSQMHYQLLGRPIREQQQGRLPYIAQNQWLDGFHHKAATPIEQWPGMHFGHHPTMQRLQVPFGQ